MLVTKTALKSILEKASMKSKDIYHVCSRCGTMAHVATDLAKGVPFERIKPCYEVSTFHWGLCDCCGLDTYVTEVRDFFYPDFDLINKKALTKYEGAVNGTLR